MSEQYKKNLQMETDILRKVRHPNIIQMNEIFETDEYLFLVMELVTGGELFDKIVEKGWCVWLGVDAVSGELTPTLRQLHRKGGFDFGSQNRQRH